MIRESESKIKRSNFEAHFGLIVVMQKAVFENEYEDELLWSNHYFIKSVYVNLYIFEFDHANLIMQLHAFSALMLSMHLRIFPVLVKHATYDIIDD